MQLEGQRFSQYRIKSLLDSGGMSKVYLAEDTRLHRPVAIKVMSIGMASLNTDAVDEALRLFQIEARAITMLDHPHILPLFDYGEEEVDGMIFAYMVMPYRADGSLANWARKRNGSLRLSLKETAHFLVQAADALQYAHDNQLIHRDVKPSNFLIWENKKRPARPDIQLADFGVVKFMNAISTPSHTIRGTPIYMAPEQWRGEAVPATDQYALAAMVYELLTGRPPFEGENQQQILYQHIYVQPEPLRRYNPHIPEKIESVVMKGLRKRPENRFESVSAFARAFQQALVHGDNVHLALTIEPSEAEYGTRREVTLPQGRKVIVAVPPGAFHGQVMRLDGLGERTVHGGLGALIITLFIAHTEEVSAISDSRFLQRTVEEFDDVDVTQHSGGSFSRGKAFLLVVLALVLVLGGLGAVLYSTNTSSSPSQKAPLAANTVPVAKTSTSVFTPATNSQTGTTPQPNYSATATATAAQATAIASSIAATATAVAVHAQATATAYAGIIMQGNQSFNDPLLDNSLGKNWDVSNLPGGGGCGFMQDGYHSTIPQTDLFSPCFARATDFTNFSYQVRMMILHGDRGGICFRASAANGNFYYFYISRTGSYALQIYENYVLTATLVTGSSSAIKTGLKQPNLIAVVANGDSLNLYVNMQLVAKVNDSTYIDGQIGVVAEDINNPTDIVFSHAQVWTQ
ncbi:MAG TPA: protein kinase [Ktedonobacteraceae bacterium]|nr:protein kinase [Ktedonobacteraceae bacterium]